MATLNKDRSHISFVQIVDDEGTPTTASGGVTGPGTAAAATRTTLASDDPAVELLGNIDTSLSTPATSVPHTALDATSDLSYAFSSSSSSGEVTLVSATASQTTRAHRMVITAAAATVIEIRDGASGTALWTVEFPAAGAYIFDFDPRPWVKTTANTALIRNSTVATKVTVSLWYVKTA